MTPEEVISLVRMILRQEFAPILMASIVSTEDQFRCTTRRFAAEGSAPNRRQIKPFGVSSRAPKGTDVVMVPVNGDPTHMNICGEFDQNRPSLDEGETILYAADGHLIYLKNGKTIHVGGKTAASPLVLGDVLKSFATDLLDQVIAAVSAVKDGPVAVTTTPGNPAPTYPALASSLDSVISALNAIRSQYVDEDTTNFVSGDNFTQRSN